MNLEVGCEREMHEYEVHEYLMYEHDMGDDDIRSHHGNNLSDHECLWCRHSSLCNVM